MNIAKKGKLIPVGNSTGVVIPKELLNRLRLEVGDQVIFTESPDGFVIRHYDPAFEEQMNAVEKIMKEDRDILRELSK